MLIKCLLFMVLEMCKMLAQRPSLRIFAGTAVDTGPYGGSAQARRLTQPVSRAPDWALPLPVERARPPHPSSHGRLTPRRPCPAVRPDDRALTVAVECGGRFRRGPHRGRACPSPWAAAAELTQRTRLSPEPDHPLLDLWSETPPDSFPTATGGSIFPGTSLSAGAVAGGAATAGCRPGDRRTVALEGQRGRSRASRLLGRRAGGEGPGDRAHGSRKALPRAAWPLLSYPAESTEGRGPPSSPSVWTGRSMRVFEEDLEKK